MVPVRDNDGSLRLCVERFEALEGETGEEQVERVRGIVERMLDGE